MLELRSPGIGNACVTLLKHAPHHACYNTEFSRARLNHMDVDRGSQKFGGRWGAAHLGWGVADP